MERAASRRRRAVRAGRTDLEPILTHTLEIPVDDGATMGAFVARPPGRPRSAVIVAGELFGLSAHVRAACERLAATGHLAVAPDLYHRDAPWIELAEDEEGRARGFALLERMTRSTAITDLESVLHCAQLEGTSRVGILGLSVGGHIAYIAAAELDLHAVAIAYAGWLTSSEIPLSRPEPTLALTERIRAPLLYLVGEHDQLIPAEERRQIAARLRSAGVRHQLVEYPGAGHGFLNARRPTYDAEAAGDAWQRIERLFQEELS